MSFFVVRLFSKLVLDAPKITANALQIIKSFCDDEVSDILIQFYAMLPVYSLCVRLSIHVFVHTYMHSSVCACASVCAYMRGVVHAYMSMYHLCSTLVFMSIGQSIPGAHHTTGPHTEEAGKH